MTRLSTTAARLAATVLATVVLLPGARAQDVELYDRPDFGGVRLTLSEAVTDVGAYGIGGRVSSLVVRRGQWEFCTQVRFGGACIAVGPGRYGQLPPALRGNLASLRPLGTVAAPPPAPAPAPAPVPGAAPGAGPNAVILFEGEFGGPQVAVTDAVDDLRSRDFNDRARTVDVQGGAWVLCTDGGHRGRCLRLEPGRHRLPPEYGQRISSLRPDAAGVAGPGPAPGRPPAVVLFEHTGFGGRQLPISGATPRLGQQFFNDVASSVEIVRGRWQLCEHADYQGRCEVLGPGRHALGGAFHDSISSLRPVFGSADQPLPAAGGVTLYEHADFDGRALLRTEATPNLKPLGFNDRASSIEVHGGRWELCSDGGYGGRCELFGPGRHLLDGVLADRVSSLRPR